MRRIGKGFSRVDTPLFDGMLVPQQARDVKDAAEDKDAANETCATLTKQVANLEQDKVAQAIEITKMKQRVRRLEKKRQVKSSGLKRLRKDKGKGILVKEPKPLKRQAHIEQDEAFARELEAELNANINWNDVVDQVKRKEKQDNTTMRYQALNKKPVTEAQERKNIMTCATLTKQVANLEQDKVAQAIEITKMKQRVRRLEKKRQVKSSGLKKLRKERLPESQAEVYHLDLEHVEKVLSMQDTYEAEPTKVEEVIEVVTAAKLMTKVVTTAAQVPKDSAPRKRRDKGEEEITEQEEGSKTKDISPEQRETKKQRIDEEEEELKRHLQIIVNDDDDVYTKATPLALKKYPLTRFTLEHMLNNVRLEVEKESEMSLELLSFGVDAVEDFKEIYAKGLQLLVEDLMLLTCTFLLLFTSQILPGSGLLSGNGMRDVVVEELSRLQKKRQAATNAGGSSHPPKKLRIDYIAPSVAPSAGKSPSGLRDLLARSMLSAESGAEVATTLPFVTSSISATPEYDSGVPTAPERFVISSDSSHHSANASKVEGSSIIRTVRPDVAGSSYAPEGAFIRAMENSLCDEVTALKGRNAILEKERDALDGKLKVVNDKLKKLYADFVDMALHLEEIFYPRLLTTIFDRRWLLTHGMELAVTKCLHSSEYLSALRAAIGKAIEKQMQDGLAVKITHGANGRTLANVAAYNPSAEADYVFAMQRLQNINFSLLAELRSSKDVSVDTIMNILCLEDNLVERL
nr:hypothetical protein [Tanacetum cinerariifolium]